jgi:hypothetical protein
MAENERLDFDRYNRHCGGELLSFELILRHATAFQFFTTINNAVLVQHSVNMTANDGFPQATRVIDWLLR